MDRLLAKTLHGLEDVLKLELESLGAGNIRTGKRSVSFEGGKELLYRANYSLRTALSILKPLCSFNISSDKDLYTKSLEYPWEKVMSVGQTFYIVPVVHSSLFRHTAYPALVLKDAIVDRFRKISGRRPSVEQKNPDIVLNCHISDKRADISIDSTVIPLFKRGYRLKQAEAPLNEVLAAGIVRLSGWDMEKPLLDPMCGSGTIAIEAAMLAKRIPPGYYRRFFGFMNWPDYDLSLFNRIKEEENSGIISLKTSVTCRDISPETVKIARANIKNAGLEKDIKTGIADFLESEKQENELFLIINPPYGERLETDDICGMYSGIGERLKHAYTGSETWILSSNIEAIKHIGLRPSEKIALYNGKLEVRLLKFELYSGSKKGGA